MKIHALACLAATRLEYGQSAKNAEDVPHVPDLLLSLGVHFVIVSHLNKIYLDGTAFCLDSRPVAVLTLRYDRIDAAWFVLIYELGHIVAEHQGSHWHSRNL